MIKDEETRFELSLESLWHDMDKMTKEELEMYTERLYTKVCSLKYEQRAKEEEERYWAHENVVAQVQRGIEQENNLVGGGM